MKFYEIIAAVRCFEKEQLWGRCDIINTHRCCVFPHRQPQHKKLDYKQTGKCGNLPHRYTTYRRNCLNWAKDLILICIKYLLWQRNVVIGELPVRRPSLEIAGMYIAMVSPLAMDGEPLERALMGTSPQPIWGSIPNKRELVSAKHHNKLVFLINILFLL